MDRSIGPKLLTRLSLFAPIILMTWAPVGVADDSAGRGLTAGITGHYRVGRWTAVRLPSSLLDEASSSESASSVIAIETIDGDGVRVRYEQDVRRSRLGYGYAIAGGEAAPLIVRRAAGGSLSDDADRLSTRFPIRSSPARGESMIPVEMPWIVSIGDALGIDGIGANELLDREASVAVSKPTESSQLPDSSLGYDGVDLIVITGDGGRLLSGLSVTQQAAMTDWLSDGGHVLLTLGASSESLIDDAPWLMQWLPMDSKDLAMVSIDPSAVETFTSTRVPLDAFRGIRLPRDEGTALIVGRTTRRISTPIAARFGFGFGQVTVIAADLNSEPFVDWPDRLGLIVQLTGDILSTRDSQQTVQPSRATAFDDLAGQARSTLDQFPMKRKFGFSVISLIVLSLVALIGPLDYLLINRVFGSPLLGWLTFPLTAIGLSALLVFQSGPRVDSSVSGVSSEDHAVVVSSTCAANRLEIVDIDTVTGRGRLFSWDMIYSHPANRIDVDVRPSSLLDKFGVRMMSNVTHPYGYPGNTFGGIQIAGEDLRMPSYRIVMDGTGDELTGDELTGDGESGDVRRFDGKVGAMPLAPAAASRWRLASVSRPTPSNRSRFVAGPAAICWTAGSSIRCPLICLTECWSTAIGFICCPHGFPADPPSRRWIHSAKRISAGNWHARKPWKVPAKAKHGTRLIFPSCRGSPR